MRFLAIGACLLLLAGCEHYVDLTEDDFLPGNAAPQQFAHDNTACQDRATIAQTTAGGNGDPHGIYNREYRDCMQRLGYHPRSPLGFGGM
jgi:hypothetical protein